MKEGERRKMNSPERDITPLLGSKLPQLRLVMCTFPIYEVIDISIGVIFHVHLFRGSATMGAKEEEWTCLAACATILISGAL